MLPTVKFMIITYLMTYFNVAIFSINLLNRILVVINKRKKVLFSLLTSFASEAVFN